MFTDDEGNMKFAEDHSKAGDTITLRFEMETLVVFNTCPHPMDPATEYPRKPIQYALYIADPVAEDDIV